MRTTTILIASLVAGAAANKHVSRLSGHTKRGDMIVARDAPKKVVVQLFEWTYDSVAKECTEFLGPAGYGYVQVSPATEHIAGPQWWTVYQAVSYKLESRHGSRESLKNMVNTCHAAGVKVIIDIIWNHMAGVESSNGVAGTAFEHYNYPGIYQPQDFHYCGKTQWNDIANWDDPAQIYDCELSNLADLKTEDDYVRRRLAEHTQDLQSLGIDGLRIDAAKHIPAADIANIISRLPNKPEYITQEVDDPRGLFAPLHTASGQVQEFRFSYAVKDAFTAGNIATLANITSRGWLNSADANIFVTNHDSERNGRALTYKSAKSQYRLGHVLSMSFGYGTPTVFSGYDWTNKENGPPSAAPSCFEAGGANGWECQHRWNTMAQLVSFYNTVGDAPTSNIITDAGPNRLAYARGDKGYVAINNSDQEWQWTFRVAGMKGGHYCDVYAGKKTGDATCSGRVIRVAAGQFMWRVPPNSAIILHVGAKLNY